MRKTLEELWRGNIDPQVKQVVQGSEYHKIQERIMRSQNRIFEMLNEEQRKYFDIYCENKDDEHDMDLQEAFIYGYRLGAKLTIEAMDENDGCIIDMLLD